MIITGCRWTRGEEARRGDAIVFVNAATTAVVRIERRRAVYRRAPLCKDSNAKWMANLFFPSLLWGVGGSGGGNGGIRKSATVSPASTLCFPPSSYFSEDVWQLESEGERPREILRESHYDTLAPQKRRA